VIANERPFTVRLTWATSTPCPQNAVDPVEGALDTRGDLFRDRFQLRVIAVAVGPTGGLEPCHRFFEPC
jgi:hypothetical protein